MDDRVLKAYIRDKYGLKVKTIGFGLGYYLVQRFHFMEDSFTELYNHKIYTSLNEIIDELKKEELDNGK